MKLLDSSVWLAHLFEANQDCTKLIESDTLLFASILTLFEVKKKLLKEKFEQENIINSIDFIKKRAIIVNLNEEIVNLAVEVAIKNHLAAIDSLVYASALKVGAKFITADNDFRGLEDVEIVEKQ